MYIEQNYQGRAARIYQKVEEAQEHALPKYDQEEAHSLQKPVDHVELHRNQVPFLSQDSGGPADTSNIFILFLPEPIQNSFIFFYICRGLKKMVYIYCAWFFYPSIITCKWLRNRQE